MPNLAYDGKSGQVLWHRRLRFTKTEHIQEQVLRKLSYQAQHEC
jgi:hypothetical protein